ncbi:MAG: hypothetical protein V1780_00525 [Chloroflexota bacterium]
MADETEDSKKKKEVIGFFIPAGLFLGMGIGWVFGSLVAGTLIGLGAGFLAMAIFRLNRPRD